MSSIDQALKQTLQMVNNLKGNLATISEDEKRQFQRLVAALVAEAASELSKAEDVLSKVSRVINNNKLSHLLGFSSHPQWLQSLGPDLTKAIERGSKSFKSTIQGLINIHVCWGPDKLSLLLPSFEATGNVQLGKVEEWLLEHELRYSSNIVARISSMARNIPWEVFSVGLASVLAEEYMSTNSSARILNASARHFHALELDLKKLVEARSEVWVVHFKQSPSMTGNNQSHVARVQGRLGLKASLQSKLDNVVTQLAVRNLVLTFDEMLAELKVAPQMASIGVSSAVPPVGPIPLSTSGQVPSSVIDPRLLQTAQGTIPSTTSLISITDIDQALDELEKEKDAAEGAGYDADDVRPNMYCKCDKLVDSTAIKASFAVVMKKDRRDLDDTWGHIAANWILLQNLCWACLRMMAGFVGCMTKFCEKKDLLKFFQVLIMKYNASGSSGILELKTGRHHILFRKGDKPDNDDLRMGVKRFVKQAKIYPAQMSRETMLQYIFGNNWAALHAEYENSGTCCITAANVDWQAPPVMILEHPSMAWLNIRLREFQLYDDVFGECSTLRDLCEEEAKMYLYHQKPDNNKSNFGWNRLQYYSIGQIIARADPAHYIASVALRPDSLSSPFLISWPYYVRYATHIEKSEFYHLDINCQRAFDHGEFLSCVQSSISLTDEDEGCCVVVVDGFHRSFKQWWSELKDADKNRGEYGCCRIDANSYGLEQQKRFGSWRTVPCNVGTMRFSKPEILHGSSGSHGGSSTMPGIAPSQITRPRLNYLPWMARVDIMTNEIEYGHHKHLSLLDLIKDVHEMRVPEWTLGNVSGKKYTVVSDNVVHLNTTAPTALGKAITMTGSWKDPEALATLEKLLGPVVAETKKAVARERFQLLNWAVSRFRFLREHEASIYGEDSFYRAIDAGQEPIMATVENMADILADAEADA